MALCSLPWAPLHPPPSPPGPGCVMADTAVSQHKEPVCPLSLSLSTLPSPPPPPSSRPPAPSWPRLSHCLSSSRAAPATRALHGASGPLGKQSNHTGQPHHPAPSLTLTKQEFTGAECCRHSRREREEKRGEERWVEVGGFAACSRCCCCCYDCCGCLAQPGDVTTSCHSLILAQFTSSQPPLMSRSK